MGQEGSGPSVRQRRPDVFKEVRLEHQAGRQLGRPSPFIVDKRNTPLSYKINIGDRILPSVHIPLLKAYTPRQEGPKVQRVTLVLEPDTVTDQLDDQYAEAKVTGSVVTDSREKDIRSWEEDYKDILTK